MPKSPVRVLQVSKLYYPWIGGVEKAVKDLSEALVAFCGCSVTVLCCSHRGFGTSERKNGVEIARCMSIGMVLGMPISLTFPFKLCGLAGRYDIVHLHMPFPTAAAAAALCPQAVGRARLVVHYHSDIVRQRALRWAYAPFLTRLLERADRIIVASPTLLRSRDIQRFHAKSSVIPFPIDLQKYAALQQGPVYTVRDRWGIPPGHKIVLFVGRFVYYKGLEYLLQAMHRVDAVLLLVGTGPLERWMRRYATRTGVDHKVRFAGAVADEELPAYYASADVFVLPSVEPTEAFGIVQLEAMACGLPVVNTQLTTGVPWVSVHGETGFTVRPRDSAALAEAVNTILRDEDLAARFSLNARSRVKMFDRRTVVDQVYALYQEILKSGDPEIMWGGEAG